MSTSSSDDSGSRGPPSIYIIGAQSTGKTTLVNALRNHFSIAPNRRGQPISPPVILAEVAREVLRTHSYSAVDIATSPPKALRLQQLILRAQSEAERAAGHGWFISDRSGVDTAIYAELFGGAEALTTLMREPSWHDSIERMRAAVVVVCEAGVPWLVDDGTRLMPGSVEEWHGFHDRFCHRLQTLNLNFTVLSREVTALEARVAFVIDVWEGAASVGRPLPQR